MIQASMPSPIGHALAGAAIAWSVNLRGPGPLSTLDARPQTPGSTPEAALNVVPRWTEGPSPGSIDAFTLLCAFLAAAPDLDLFVPYAHRAGTHSLLAVAVVAIFSIIAMTVTGRVTGPGRVGSRRAVIAWQVVLACTAAYASHLFLDWLGADDTPPRGLQILWPFSDRWFISDLDLFRGTARRDVFSALSMRTNALALVQEIAILGPVALAAWLERRRALAGPSRVGSGSVLASKSRSRARTCDPSDRPQPSDAGAGTVGTSDRPDHRAARPG